MNFFFSKTYEITAAGIPKAAAYKKKLKYPKESTKNPENPLIMVAGKVAKRKSAAYCVAVKDRLVRPDSKAIRAVEATPWLKLSKVMVTVSAETLWPIVSNQAKATLVSITNRAPKNTTAIKL